GRRAGREPRRRLPYPARPGSRAGDRRGGADVGDTDHNGGVSVLDRFTPATADWFRGAFAAPTPAQEGAWAAVAAGRHALVVAPTGSGKTLAAFLWAIDRVFRERAADAAQAAPGEKRVTRGTRILYI